MINDNGKPRMGKQWRVALFLLMAAVGGGIGYYVYRQRSVDENEIVSDPGWNAPGQNAPKLTPEQVLAALELKDTSIGHLENGPSAVAINGRRMSGMAAAAQGFEKLAEQLPTETLPLQNLVISRLLILQNAQRDVEQGRAGAREAARRFLEFAPESAVAHYLAAKVELQPDPANPTAVTDEVRAKAVVLLQKATELAPDNAAFWLALAEAATSRHDKDLQPVARNALEKAYQRNPRNIYLITEMLMMQANAKDAAIVQTLTGAKEVFRSLAPAAQRRSRFDLMERMDLAIKAAQQGDWRNVVVSATLLRNVVRPDEVAKSDISRVVVHPLEYLLYDFSSDFYASYGRPTPDWKETSPVTLQVAADDTLDTLQDVVAMSVMDFSLDGLPDILVLQPGKLRILSRARVDQPWVELASIEVPRGMTGVLAADLDRDRRKAPSAPAAESDPDDPSVRFDNVVSATETCHDADPDIVLYGAEGVMVIRNDLHAERDAAKLVIVANPDLRNLTQVASGLLFDMDHDGELDLGFSSAEGVTIWQAGAQLSYTNVSEFSQMPPATVPLTTMVAVDWDRDADIDVVMSEPSGQLAGYLENLRHGEFRWTEFGDQYGHLASPRQLAVLEADGNVSWDLLTVGQNGVHTYLTATPRSGVVNFMRAVQVTDRGAAGVLTWDYDNDGFRDAAVWGDAGLSVWRGGPDAAYVLAEVVQSELTESVRTVACVDMDRDGDQDLVVATRSRVSLLRNQGESDHAWITLYPLGQSDNKGRCNHNAIGSLVELRSGGWYQAQVVDAPTVHFGLGEQPVAQQIRVVWTNGIPQDIVGQAGNVAICEPMALKGSCPYVYTMAHGEFSFFTDCLWAAPLGMQTAEGTIAPTRSWEYLLIPGERLTPHEGAYWVMMTEELWEAGYFDKVQLIAIDHPAEVEVYSNEKVGPGDMARCQVHTVRKRRFPVGAVDQQGRDLRAKLKQRDGDFVRAFEQRLRQGLTPEHYIELDLGALDDPRRITLFLTGWIFPTDTSLNVAFSQDPETDGPRMPWVSVPDREGQWQEAIAYMGFPGGKTKTIAVDLSQAFLTADYRVRIATTAEIYWDEVFFTVDDPDVEVRQIPLTLESAELAYRGFSQELPRTDQSPQMYDFGRVRSKAAWPAMRGNFTRYGHVGQLVAEGDDMMAVLGAGDAMTLRFAVPEQSPPAGWKRDFFLHSIGWDKDADLNTIHGQTVEPLPFRGMSSYPFDPDDVAPGGAAYQEYLQRYQNRQQDPRAFWRQLLLEN